MSSILCLFECAVRLCSSISSSLKARANSAAALAATSAANLSRSSWSCASTTSWRRQPIASRSRTEGAAEGLPDVGEAVKPSAWRVARIEVTGGWKEKELPIQALAAAFLSDPKIKKSKKSKNVFASSTSACRPLQKKPAAFRTSKGKQAESLSVSLSSPLNARACSLRAPPKVTLDLHRKLEITHGDVLSTCRPGEG